MVDDETGDKHELYEVLRMPSRTKNRCLAFFTEGRRGIKMSIASKNIEKILLTILAIVLP